MRLAWLPGMACAGVLLVAAGSVHVATGQQRTEPRPQPPATGAVRGEPATDPAGQPAVEPPEPPPFVGPPAPPLFVGPPVPPLFVGPPVPPPFVGPPAPGIEELAENLYVVTGYDSNVVARVTPEGVVVTGGLSRDHDVVAAWIESVTDQPIRYVVGTRRRANGAGGGAAALPPAWGAARIVAPESAAEVPPGGGQPHPDPPDVAFTAQASLFLGGAEIQVHHFGPAQTGGDAAVLFPDHGVLYAGDLVVLGAPLIDYARGGSGRGWVDALGGVLALDFETVIPGRGPALTKPYVQALRDRLVTLRMRAMQLIRLGVPREDVLARMETADLDWKLAPAGPFATRSFAAFYDELQVERAEWTPADPDEEPGSDVVGDLSRTPQSR